MKNPKPTGYKSLPLPQEIQFCKKCKREIVWNKEIGWVHVCGNPFGLDDNGRKYEKEYGRG